MIIKTISSMIIVFLLILASLTIAKSNIYESESTKAAGYYGFDYEDKVMKARAYMDLLSSRSSMSHSSTIEHYYSTKSSSLDQMAGLNNPYDERFSWMKPFEFYECEQQ
ncbi:hypothetical protein RDWZM_001633 [Blomia tropicalis]|uniref:Uncharacterized protein n=1 Tax=Blomia tropicalis TaxID=40697 RepID=A0A9Q0RP53_BLOTA|nr:hypothetical protein RDWZM_001633 [Blomia tropicalis]